MYCSTSKHRWIKAKLCRHSVLPTAASTTADTVSNLIVSAPVFDCEVRDG